MTAVIVIVIAVGLEAVESKWEDVLERTSLNGKHSVDDPSLLRNLFSNDQTYF